MNYNFIVFVGCSQSTRVISESALFVEAAGATDESSTTDSDLEDGIDDDLPPGLSNGVSPKKGFDGGHKKN